VTFFPPFQSRLFFVRKLTQLFILNFSPRLQLSEKSWGSGTVGRRDWGLSEPCAPAILADLLEELKRNCSEYEYDQSLDIPSKNRLVLDLAEIESSASHDDCPIGVASSFSSTNHLELEVSGLSSGHVQFTVAEDLLLEEDAPMETTRDILRRHKSLAKRRRTALFACARDPVKTIREARKSMFVQLSQSSLAKSKPLLPESSPEFFSHVSLEPQALRLRTTTIGTTFPLDESRILERILDHLQEKELLHSASLVSRKWFEVATISHANLMLSCLGCENQDCNSIPWFESTNNSLPESNHALSLMERPWDYLTRTFPWACFLAEGAYKKVYKVFNHKLRVEEAVSVM
jgi:hypothetical protein